MTKRGENPIPAERIAKPEGRYPEADPDLVGYRADDSSDRQAIRFPKSSWTASAASAACKARKGKFEAASKDLGAEETDPMPDIRDEGKAPFQYFKVLPSEVKAVDTDSEGRWVEGLASTTGVDEAMEVMDLGCFGKGLEKFMLQPVYTYIHDWRWPIGTVGKIEEIGTVDAVEERDRGLYTRSCIFPEGEDELADKAYTRIKHGAVRTQSVGFDEYYDTREKSGYWEDDDSKIWHWGDVQLRDVAAVPLACNVQTTLYIAKSLGLPFVLPGTEQKEDPEEAAIRKAQTEEERFTLDLQRLKGSSESVHNIVAHWSKEGRVPSAEHLETVTTARDALDTILQPDADAGEGEVPLALTVPKADKRLMVIVP